MLAAPRVRRGPPGRADGTELSRPLPPALAGALAAVLLVAGCRGGEHRAAAPPSPRPSPSASGTPAEGTSLAAYYTQRLSWHTCGDGFSCTTLRVPLDYAHPRADQLRIAVIKRPASSKRRIGSLVINPGGPGASGVAYARFADEVVSTAVRDRFDVVGFDPRGVGGSSPIRCVPGRDLDAFLAAPPAPRTAADVRVAVHAAKRLAAGCGKRAGTLLRHVGTLDAARDIDVLRAALGDAKLTYLGKSYGTYLGAKYAELFPRRIRAAVLDGALDPALSFRQLNAGQGVGFETDLQDFLRYCGSTGVCGSSAKSSTARLDTLLAGLRNGPLPAPDAPGARRLHLGEAIFGIAAGLYSTQTWPQLGTAIRAAERGDGSTLLRFSDELADRDADGHYSNQLEANTAINCLDHPSARDVSAYARAAAVASRLAPHFGPPLAWGSLTCAFWPVPPTDSPHPVRAPGAPPILVVGNVHDPATPYAWAQSLSRQLPGALLTYEADGHTAYRKGSSCIDDAVDTYLLTLRLPAPGTRCH